MGGSDLRAIVAANVAGRPGVGGHVAAIDQWVGGLRQAGAAVTLMDIGDDAVHHVRPSGFREVDFAISIMGAFPHDGSVTAEASVFVDIDPGYPQMWHELGLVDMFGGHDLFVSTGENLGRTECRVPTCGLNWITTPPPVVLDHWPVTAAGRKYTTVATWRNPYGTVRWGGVTYGSRVHEFRKFIELPRVVGVEFELALDIDAAEVRDLRALEANGWRLVDPRYVAGDPAAYRRYIQYSRAELCVAQNIYVGTRCGWLSERSICYLASGKPVIAQDTGFSTNYPVGEGLLAFSTLEEAAAAIESVECDYERHSAAARALAEEYFDASKVLGRLLTAITATGVGVGK
jgi:hypothetical protein